MSRQYIRHILSALAITHAAVGYGETASAEKVTSFNLYIRTEKDDREGGLVTITLKQGDTVIAVWRDPERSWDEGQEVHLNAVPNYLREIPDFDPTKSVTALIKLEDGREINICWHLFIEVVAKTDRGREFSFKKQLQLDTTYGSFPLRFFSPRPPGTVKFEEEVIETKVPFPS